MQNQKKENSKKPHPSQGKPHVINPKKEASPQEIEREIFLKQIEALQYKVRNLNSKNFDLKLQLFEASESVAALKKLVEMQHQAIQHRKATNQQLIGCMTSNAKTTLLLRKLIKCLTEGQEWKPEVQKIIQAASLPICSN
jgi:hypothetical protein